MSSRGVPGLVGALLVVVSVLGLGAGSALASGHASSSLGVSGPVRRAAAVIVAPASGAVVLGASARVRVRLAPGVVSFGALVGSRVVTGAFRSRDDVRVAALRYGGRGGLPFGRSTLYVRTVGGHGRRSYAQVSFVVAHRFARLLRGVVARSTCAAGATLRVGLARRGVGLRVWVNGRATSLAAKGRNRVVLLDADNGLRPGVNVIRVRAVDARDGTYALGQVRLLMALASPVAGGGTPRRGRVGQSVRLDAGASLAAVSGSQVHYRWVILRAPRGSRARLRDATSRTPLLRPDRPGRYLLQVTVTQGPLRAPTAGLGRVGGLCAAPGTSTNTVSVVAAVSSSATGVALDTIASRKDPATGKTQIGVLIGDGVVADGGSFSAVPDPTKALQLVVLDRQTLEVISNQSYSNWNPDGAADLLKAVQALKPPPGTPSPDLVIITRPNPTVTNIPPGRFPSTALDQALTAIGVSSGLPFVDNSNLHVGCGVTGQCSAFSAIGVPGAPAGQGDLNPGLSGVPGSGVPGGDLHGDLAPALDPSNGFVFVNRERVPFDTGDPAANPAVVTVGSDDPGSSVAKQTYTSAKLDGPGFYVVVLDAGSLTPIWNRTYVLANTPPAGVGNLTDMANQLGQLRGEQSVTVIVRSIGAVKPLTTGVALGAWDAVANALVALGGSRFYFDALNGDPGPNGSDQYAQVGPSGQSGGYPSPWTQVASHEHSIPGPLPVIDGHQVAPGRLTGLLARNPSWQFYPGESTRPDTPLLGTLPGLISTPAVAWPDRTGGDGNAVACIAAHINPVGALKMPIESHYTNQTLSHDWAAWGSDLDTDAFKYQTLTSPPDNCSGFTDSQLTDVEHELKAEFTAVTTVWDMMSGLEAPFIGPAGSSSVIGSAAAHITASLNPPPAAVTVNPLEVTEDVLWIASALPIPIVSNFLNAAAGAAALALALDVNSTDAPPDLSVTAADLATALQATYNDTIAGLDTERDILLEDRAKLLTAAQNAANTTNAAADWSWGKDGLTAANTRIGLAAARLAYQTLFPIGYRLYRITAGTGILPPELASYTCVNYLDDHEQEWKPFGGSVPQSAALRVFTSGNGAYEHWVYATPDTSFLEDPGGNPQFPSQTVLNDMFTSPGGAPPLFGALQFAVEAYTDGSTNVIPVTHIVNSDPFYNNQLCTVG